MNETICSVLDFFKEFNLQTIISLAFIVWYFTNDLKKSLEGKIDTLDKDVRAMNTRIGRVEGTVYGKDVYKMTEDK